MQALYPLSYSPMVRCGARYSQSPGVAGLSSAASPRSGRHGGPADNGAHAMDVSTSKHVHLRVVRAGTAGVEPAFRSGWSRVAYPLADPQINENRPGNIPGAVAFFGLMPQVTTVLVLRASSRCEHGFIYPSRFALFRNVIIR